MAHVAVIGAGVAGLTAAYRLRRLGHEVDVFEKEEHAGGKIRTERAEGYLVEYGPSALQHRTPLLDKLLGELELRAASRKAVPAAQRRYVAVGRQPVPVPTSLPAFIGSELLSPRGKLRLLLEPFIRSPTRAEEESVAAFAQRRLGAEALDYGINPLVAGVFAGDPKQLSMEHALPRLHQLEREYGSLLVGQLRKALSRQSKDRQREERGLFSLRGGLQSLTDALVDALDDAITYEAEVTAIQNAVDTWTVSVRHPDQHALHRCDAVLYAAPLHALRSIEIDTGHDLTPMREVPYPPVSVLSFGLRREDVEHPLDGFGLLVPGTEEDYRILGTLFSSTLFPERAPEGYVLLTTYIGGMRRPELARAATDTLSEIAFEDLHRLLGLRARPHFVRHTCWRRALPQYHLGYGRVKKQVSALEARHPNFFLAGNYRRGISVGDTVASGDEAARRLDERLS